MKNKLQQRQNGSLADLRAYIVSFLKVRTNILTLIECIAMVFLSIFMTVVAFENSPQKTIKKGKKEDNTVVVTPNNDENEENSNYVSTKTIDQAKTYINKAQIHLQQAETCIRQAYYYTQNEELEETPVKEKEHTQVEKSKNEAQKNDEGKQIPKLKAKDINEYRITDIKGIYQMPELPTGCEATALTTLMNFKGIKVDKYEIAMKYMPRNDLYFKDGVLYGPNPVRVFVGNPAENSGLGCFAPCLVQTFKNYLKNNKEQEEKFEPIDLTGTEFKDILKKYVANEVPVVVIVSQYLSTPFEGATWKLKYQGSWTWMVNHHAMVIHGFNFAKNEVYVCDPLNQNGMGIYDLQKFEEIYNLKGKSAMTIIKF